MNRCARHKRPQCNDTVPAFLFDLDGTLIDSVYRHVLAWREAHERLAPSLAMVSSPSGASIGGSGSWRATLPLPRLEGYPSAGRCLSATIPTSEACRGVEEYYLIEKAGAGRA